MGIRTSKESGELKRNGLTIETQMLKYEWQIFKV